MVLCISCSLSFFPGGHAMMHKNFEINKFILKVSPF